MAEKEPPRFNTHFARVIFIIPKEPPPTLKNPGAWSNEFKDFLATCLNKDPKLRPNAKDLLKVREIMLPLSLSYAPTHIPIQLNPLAPFYCPWGQQEPFDCQVSKRDPTNHSRTTVRWQLPSPPTRLFRWLFGCHQGWARWNRRWWWSWYHGQGI